MKVADMRRVQKIKGSLLTAIVTAMISFAALPLASSFAETVTYTYDSMNRLKQAQYASGLTIAYDYDGMGNMTQRAVVSTDTTAPTTPVIASPVNGGVINASNVTLSGTAETWSTVKVYNSAALLGSAMADASGAWSYITTLLADGSYSFTATATDAAGNVSGTSPVVVASIQTSAPTTTASPPGGTYNSARSVTLSCFEGTGSGCDKIYYTTDDSTPTIASSVYSVPISISSTTTLNYFATNLSGHSEAVKSQTYTIDSATPVTTASPAGGSYNTTQSVTMTCDDGAGSGCGKIYYTTDGTIPTTASSAYSGAISIASTTTLKYFAVDLAGNSETMKSETYTLPNCYWTNTSGGNWSTATNWSCGHAPTATDNAFITLNGTYTVTLDTSATVNDFVIGGSFGTQALSANSKTLAINGVSTVGSHATMNLSSSTVSGAGSITNNGTINLSSGTLNTALVNGGTVNAYGTSAINGALTTQSGSLLHVETNTSCSSPYSSVLTVANGFTNNGTIELVGQGGTCNYAATLTVTSGTLVNAAGGNINSLVGGGYGSRYLYSVVNNQGTLTVGYPLTISKSSAAHTNSGTIAVNANLTVSQSGTSPSFTNTGTIALATGTTLSVNNGTFNQNAGAMLGGAGATLSLSSLTANLQTAIGVSTLSLYNTTANLTSDMNLALQNLILNGSTVNGAVTITNPAGKALGINYSTVNTALVNGGTVNAYGTSAINGALTTLSGSLLHVETNTSCSSPYSSVLTVANGFTNNGTIELVGQGGTCNYAATLTVTSGTLVNAAGGNINSLVGGGYGSRYLYSVVNNQGTLTVGYPLTISKSSAAHTNSGTIAVNANLTVSQSSGSLTNNGVISIASGKTLSVSNGTFTNAFSGILNGSGTISFSSATFAQNGTINPGSSVGKLSITGALPQTVTSIMNMEVGGTIAGTTYDQLAVSGAATLNGTLNVSLVNGFTPSTGDSFTLMTYGSKTGTFSAVNLPPMGKLWNTTYNPTSLVLSVGGACPSISLSPASLPIGTVETAYSQSISASGGTGSYTYTLTSGSLPSGLALSSDGILSGTPTAAGTYTFTVTGTDATTCTGPVQYTMTVQTTCVAPPSGLVSWWQGEGDANDQMSRNTGSLMNGTTFAPGKVGQAFSFDGVDDAVLAGSAGLPTGEGDRAMSMWVNITQPVATDAVFAGYGAAGINDQLYMLGAQGSGNTLFFSNGTTSLAGPDLQSGRWYHVAVTNSGNLATLYLDGAVVATDTLTLSTPTNSAFFVGYLDADRKLQGAVDEVQVFNRTLPAAEIADIYNAGSKGMCDTVAPTVLAASPSQGATNVPIAVPITAIFSEAMDATTINAAHFTVSGGVTGTVTYDAGTKTATFTPSANLAYSTTYTATMTAGVKDLAGNALAVDYLWNFATEAAPDTIAPTTTASPMSGIFNATQSVTLICSDGDGSGCDKIYYTTDGSTPTTSSSVYTAPISITADTTLQYFATDLAGNSEAVKSETYTIDATAPVTTASPAGGTYSSTQSVTLTCNDGTGSGCNKIYYTTDGSTPTTASTAYSSAISISSTMTLKYFATDVAGNSETVKSQAYTIDTTAPTTTTSPGTTAFNGTLSVTLTCSDGTGAGCDKTYYTTNGTTPTTASAVYVAPISITATTTLKFFSTDMVGNSETVKSATYTLDTTAPTGTISINAAATYATSLSVTLALTYTDTNGSSQMQFSNGNVTWSAAEPYATSKAWTLAMGDGTRTVYVKFKDTAGNWSTVYSDTIILDANAPTTTASPAGGVYNANKSVTLTCADGTGSGCNKIYYTTNGTTPTTASTAYSRAISITATTTLKYFATDKAGNSEVVKSQTYTIDKTAPAGSIIINGGAASTNNFSAALTLTCTDANGCGQMQFSNDNKTWSAAEAYATTKTWTMTTGVGTKTVYVKFRDTAGNLSTAFKDTISLAASSDLTARAVSAPTSANITEPVNVTVTIANQSGDAGNFSVNIYLSTDAAITTADTYLGNITYTGTVSAGAQATVSTTVRVPSSMAAGTYYIGAMVDPPVTGYSSGYVVETNEANNALAGNAMAITAVSPDLTITTLSGPDSGNINEVVPASATIKNQGGNTGGFNVYLYLSTDAAIATTDTWLGSGTVNSLAAGAQAAFNVSGKVPSTTTAGNYYIGAIVDPPVTGYPSGYVAESNEVNNALAGNLTAVTTTAPDLTVATVSGPTSANITEPLTVQALIKNEGGSAGGFYVSAYLSTDTIITTGDSYLGSFWHDTTLSAGAQTTVNIPASIPATAAGGNYYLGVIADPSATGYPSGYVTENDETNNALAGNSVTVTATRADLTVTAVSGPTTGTKGQPIAVSSTIKNQGGTTGAFHVGIYLSTDTTITTGDTFLGYYGPVSSLAGGTSTTIGGPLTIPANLVAGTYFIGAIADYNDVVVELSGTNNALMGNQIAITP